jgi:hypothetical protein
MDIVIQYDGKTIANPEPETLADLGMPQAVYGAAVKAAYKAEVARFSDTYRAKLATSSAGKLSEYRIKEEIARDPANAAEAELALIDREAAAAGLDRDGLIALINARATAYRQIALLIGALEAEAGAAIAAIPDDADDIETQIKTTLAAAKDQADLAFADAQALIAGR